MPNRMYEASDRFEKTVLEDLEKRGYLRVDQKRGSKGSYDITAMQARHGGGTWVLLVQAKSGKKGCTHEGWNRLYDDARSVGALPVVVSRGPKRGSLLYRCVSGYHRFGSRDWPGEVYEP